MVFSETAVAVTEEGGREPCLLGAFLRCRHGLPDAFFFCRVITKNPGARALTALVPVLLPNFLGNSTGKHFYLPFETAKRNGYCRQPVDHSPTLF